MQAYRAAAVILTSVVVLRSSSALDDWAGKDAVLARLEKAGSFAFGGVGFDLGTSQGERDYRSILALPSAREDFQKVFLLGNRQAQCYALTGLRQVDPIRFEALSVALQTSTACVAVTRGCVTFSLPAHEVLESIRAGVYSGPMTRELVPPPQSAQPSAGEREQSTWERVIALLFPLPSKPAVPKLAVVPPPPSPARRYVPCTR